MRGCVIAYLCPYTKATFRVCEFSRDSISHSHCADRDKGYCNNGEAQAVAENDYDYLNHHEPESGDEEEV